MGCGAGGEGRRTEGVGWRGGKMGEKGGVEIWEFGGKFLVFARIKCNEEGLPHRRVPRGGFQEASFRHFSLFDDSGQLF
jgi:hypothetical protein